MATNSVGGVYIKVRLDDNTAQKDAAGFIEKLKTGIQTATAAMRMLGRITTQFISGLLSGAARYGLLAFRNYFMDIAQSMPEVRQAIAEIKGNLMTAAQPIVERLIPAFQGLLNILNQVAAVLADVVAKIFGTTAEQSRDNAEALNEQVKAYKATGSAAKKAGKQVASFDQLNILNRNSGASGAAAAATGKTSGASGIAAVFNNQLIDDIENKLAALEMLMGSAFLAMGAILAFSGVNIPLGIALIAVGATAIVAAASVGWDELRNQLQGPVGRIFALVSGAELVLGAILAFSGVNIPLGIALMVIGAGGLATEAAVNWDAIKAELSGPMAGIYAILSGATLVIGAILAFSGINIPLGIALIAAGAAGLVSVTALNWGSIKAALRGPMAGISTILSGATLVIGAILAFSGINIPLGIALIAAGAAGLASVTALNWGSIKEKIVGVWQEIKTWWQTTVAPIFTSSWWAGRFDSIRQGLSDRVNQAVSDAKEAFTWLFDLLKYPGGTTINSAGFSHSSGRLPGVAAGTAVPTNPSFSGAAQASIDAAVSKALANKQSQGGSKTVVLQVDKRTFGQVVLDAYDTESQRVGVSLSGGGGR